MARFESIDCKIYCGGRFRVLSWAALYGFVNYEPQAADYDKRI